MTQTWGFARYLNSMSVTMRLAILCSIVIISSSVDPEKKANIQDFPEKKAAGLSLILTPEDFRPGINATLTCSLASPTLIKFDWFHNGKPIEDVEFRRLSRTISQRSGTSGLTFESNLHLIGVGRSHIGNYTCRAYSENGKENISVFVDVPPGEFKLFDQSCKYDDECLEPSMVCFAGRCSCPHSYPVKMEKGLHQNCFQAAKLSEFCLVNEQCQYHVPHSECRLHTCECKKNFFRQASKELRGTICVQTAKYNESCKVPEQCSEHNRDLTCVGKRCTCADANATYVLSKERCLRIEPLGGMCFFKEECDDGRHMRDCIENRCSCNIGFIPNANGTSCELDIMKSRRQKSREVYLTAIAVGFCLAIAGILLFLVILVKFFRGGCGRTRKLKNPRINRHSKKTGEVVLVGAEASP